MGTEKPAIAARSAPLLIRFVTEAPPDGRILRRFLDPRTTTAVEDRSVLPPSGADTLQLILINDLKAAPEVPLEKFDVLIETDFARLDWQPGRAILQAKSTDPLLPAVIDFAFYEAELRRLEQAIQPDQALADADVSLAYHIRESGRPHWDRLYKTMEDLYRLRLQFARLEPHLTVAPPALPPQARRLFHRLLTRTQIEARLEAFNDRLEVLEDLYEGAVDRITDHRNAHKGTMLEIGIVVLLALEVILLLVRHS